MLDDGSYDIIVVDAEPLSAVAPGGEPALRLDVTILGGAHKGDMLSVRATGLGIDELDVLGMPGTLTVHDGDPTIVLDR